MRGLRLDHCRQPAPFELTPIDCEHAIAYRQDPTRDAVRLHRQHDVVVVERQAQRADAVVASDDDNQLAPPRRFATCGHIYAAAAAAAAAASLVGGV